MKLRILNNVHALYLDAARRGKDVGNKKLVTVIKNSSKEVTGGQFFEKKILPNGNIKTRILTITNGCKPEIGLETKITTSSNKLVSKTIGVIKQATSHFNKKIRLLRAKLANQTISNHESLRLKDLELAKSQNTKLYGKNYHTGFVKEALYGKMEEAKTLVGDNYSRY